MHYTQQNTVLLRWIHSSRVSAERVPVMVQDLVILLADPVLVTTAGQEGFPVTSRPQAFRWVRNKAPFDFKRAKWSHPGRIHKPWPVGGITWGSCLPVCVPAYLGTKKTRPSVESAQIFTIGEVVPGDPLWNSKPLTAELRHILQTPENTHFCRHPEGERPLEPLGCKLRDEQACFKADQRMGNPLHC